MGRDTVYIKLPVHAPNFYKVSPMTWNTSVFFASLWTAGTTLTLIHWILRCKRGSMLAYPPGPKVDSMPTHDPWVDYRDWGREFG